MTVPSKMRIASGAPYWLMRNGLFEPPERPLPSRADVLIVGAGITGALLADALVREGREVVVLERHAPAEGSTGVSTALLQYELDVELGSLADRVGIDQAVRAYRRCAEAIDDLAALAASLGDGCDFQRVTSVYLASRRRDAKRLRHEAELRQAHGFDVRPLTRRELAARYDVPGAAALETPHAAQVDPVALTRRLLNRAVAAGAIVCPRTALLEWQDEGARCRVMTTRGQCMARFVVFATGYELPPKVPNGAVALHSTYAFVTQPGPYPGPLGRGAVFWETARPYTYMRTTVDGRVLVGGMDVPFRHADGRDALLPVRVRALETRAARLLGIESLERAFAWAGTFAATPDGLPYIGRLPGEGRAFAALGYGGNGIVFSTIAAELISAQVEGRRHPDQSLFHFDRARRT
ncbi:MAG: FAD-binding oxidoreductase [Gemmatimonadales bacterium]|nr:FAD-binding oxidoreductase [Gemmatimonadales bacterium]